ncbi:MAG: preprotein translocase subunit SecE [Clostridia bacterium]|nr:preprotein translocase subunit SecE [Clostridia bacterium]
MAKTVLLGNEKEQKEKAQKKAVKAKKKQGRRGPIRFVKDIWSELKKVTWPTKKELFSYTMAVIAVVVGAALLIGLVDFGLSQLFSLIVG